MSGYSDTRCECEKCGEVSNHRVTDSRPLGGSKTPRKVTRRRKECPECGHRYTTYEVPAERYQETVELEAYRRLFGDLKAAEEVAMLLAHMGRMLPEWKDEDGEVGMATVPLGTTQFRGESRAGEEDPARDSTAIPG